VIPADLKEGFRGVGVWGCRRKISLISDGETCFIGTAFCTYSRYVENNIESAKLPINVKIDQFVS
jgi:hypothetical protein